FSTAGLRPKTRHGDDEPGDERREPHRPPTIGEDPSPSLPENKHTKHIQRESDRKPDQSKSKRGVHAEPPFNEGRTTRTASIREHISPVLPIGGSTSAIGRDSSVVRLVQPAWPPPVEPDVSHMAPR